MSFRCNYCHDTGHLRNTCHRLRSGHPSKRGFNFLLVPDPPRPNANSLPVVPLEDSTDIIYASSSPSTFEYLSKGQLMYIENMEVVALHSRAGPVETLDSSALDSSFEQVVADGPPPYTLDHYPSLPRSSSGPSLSSTPPLSPPGSSVPLPITTSSSPPKAPEFQDPSLLTALSIFLDKTPISPSTLPLDSICFKNVTIKKSKKPPLEESGDLGAYTPLSTRLK